MRTPSLLAAALAALLLSPAMAQDSRPASRPAPSPFPALGDPAGSYGAGVDLKRAVALPAAAKKVDALHGRPVRVDATITDVCRKKGCWMVIREGSETVRVRFKDYSFFVPRDASGREALIEGILTRKTISEAAAKHYAEEGGDPEKAKAIKGPQKVLAFTATGVEILGRRTLPPAAEAADPKLAAALQARLEKAKKIGGGKGKVDNPGGALRLLRSIKGPRSVEFSLYAQVGPWVVFSKEGADPFSAGFAVKKGTADVYGF